MFNNNYKKCPSRIHRPGLAISVRYPRRCCSTWYAVLNSRPGIRPSVELDIRSHFNMAPSLCQKKKGEADRIELGQASP